MALLDIGKHCSKVECKQLDFIPLKCLCGEYFCKIHFTEHCLSNSCNYYKNIENKTSFSVESPIYKCSSLNCPSSSYIKMPCVKCSKHFCIEHRFHPECPEVDPEIYKIEKERWDKPREQFNIAKALVDAEVTNKLRELQRSSSSCVTAMKIQLMKLKSKAKGEKNIPVTDRIYFVVIKPSNYTSKTLTCNTQQHLTPSKIQLNLDHAVFVSKSWSLGRVIDSISELLSIKNENNKTNEPKLRIFRESDRMCVGGNMMDWRFSQIIEKEVLLSGETILLDYINVDDMSQYEQNQALFLQVTS